MKNRREKKEDDGCIEFININTLDYDWLLEIVSNIDDTDPDIKNSMTLFIWNLH